jgi:hypothetical protein
MYLQNGYQKTCDKQQRKYERKIETKDKEKF